MNRSLKDRFLLLVVLPLFWGSTFLATKICLEELPPVWMGTFRYLISSAIFLVILWSKVNVKESLRELKTHWSLFVVVGIVGTFCAAFFQNMGLRFTTASVSSLINTLEPVLVAIMSVLFLHERLNWLGVIGLTTAFVGGFIVITNGDLGSIMHMDGTIKGNLLILLSIISYACYTIFTKILVGRTDPKYAVTFSTCVGTLALLVSAILMEGFPVLTSISFKTWFWVIYLAVFPNCVSLTLFNRLLTEVEASKVSIILFLIPLYGLALGVIFLGDSITVPMIFGGVLTLIGVWFIEYAPLKIREVSIE